MFNKSVFLVVSHVSRLAPGIKSHIKGVSSNPDNWETFENMVLVDRVSSSRVNTSSVIIDLLKGKVLKNRFDAPESEVFREYYARYQNDITEALRTWGSKSQENYLKLREIADAVSQRESGESTDETNPN